MAKRRSRSTRDANRPRFFYSVGTGLFTGLMIFFVTNCLLPPPIVARLQRLIWESWQAHELRQPQAAASSRSIEERTEPRKVAANPKIAANPKSDLPATAPQTQPARSTSSFGPSSNSPWVPVYDDAGAR
jgi:hypothetical protein